jgi:hypothetical protein
MNCNEARQHWHLYHDSEGDAALHFAINEHLGLCPACAEWFHKQSRLESLLVERTQSPPASPQLWRDVLRGAGLTPVSPGRRYWIIPGLLSGLAACAVLLLSVGVWYLVHRPSPDLSAAAAAWHERIVDGQETVEFSSESDLEVEAYLKQRVSFPVRCPPRKDAGFAVRGAGAGQIGGQPTAYLAGSVDDTPVSIFVLPRSSLDAFPRQRAAAEKETTHRCKEGSYELVLRTIDRNAVVVVGRTSPERLERVLNAYGTYPDHP